MAYWDTSALLKLYIPEPDSPYFLDLAATSSEAIISSNVAAVEILSAAYRKECAGLIKRGGASQATERALEDFRSGRIVGIPFGEDVSAAAAKIIRFASDSARPLTIRAIDAIHLGSARVAGAEVVIATDVRLRAVADVLRLALLP